MFRRHQMLYLGAEDFVDLARTLDKKADEGLRCVSILRGRSGEMVAIFEEDRALDMLLRIFELIPPPALIIDGARIEMTDAFKARTLEKIRAVFHEEMPLAG